MKINFILKQIIQVLFLILLFLLPLVNSRGLYFIGLEFYYPVNGNFEFTKVMFFNIYTSILLLLGIINIYFNKLKILINSKKYIYLSLLYLLFIVSSYFSINPYLSIFGDTNKGHNFIMFNNLIGIFLLLVLVIDKRFILKIINVLIISGILLSFIGIKEYFSPTFNYGLLLNREMSTFGHPNYLSIYLLAIIILLINRAKYINILYLFPSVLLIILSLFITKSYIAIFLFILYIIYIILNKLKLKGKKIIFLFICFVLTILSIFFIYLYTPEKLSSLMSRFYIWYTTFTIIGDNIKTFFLGGGFETLGLVFDKFKVAELYIYENIGYKADRPHNLLLNFFYSIGIFGFIYICYLYYFVIKNLNDNPVNISLLIIFIFLLFNFASVATYFLVIILFGILLFNNSDKNKNYNGIYLYIIITFVSLFGGFYSYKLYMAEVYAYSGNYKDAIKNYNFNFKYNYNTLDSNFIYNVNKKYLNLDYFIYKIQNNLDLDNSCLDFTSNYLIPETFFYCGDIYWNKNDKKKAFIYYNNGLNLLPNLWNKNSKFYNNIIIKNTISGNRFFSEKYGLKRVLDRMNIKY